MIPGGATERAQRRRAGLSLASLIVGALALVALATSLVISHNASTPATVTNSAAPASAPSTSDDDLPAEPGWNVAAQRALALRPMLSLPPEAAQPREISTQAAGEDLQLPPPTLVAGRWIPTGFSPTGEGALAQLKAMNETGLRGADPATYARAHAETALPGAPPEKATGLNRFLVSFRASAQLPETGPVEGLAVTYTVTHGLIKGSTDEGRYTVVCTLGQLSADYKGQTVSLGLGDCQAMRWTGTTWRISPGTQAAPASNAWPGSAECVQAGYRGVR